MKKYIIAVMLLGGFMLSAQPKLDSLYTAWQDESLPDTLRLKNLLRFARYGYLFSQPDSAEYFAMQALAKAKEWKAPKWQGEAAKIVGISHAIRGNNKAAIGFFSQSLKINEAQSDRYGIAGSLNNIGLLHLEDGNQEKALEYMLRSYAIYEEINNLNGKALCSGNIGIIYSNLDSLDKALEYDLLSYKFYKEMGQAKGIATATSALGTAYANYGDVYLEEDLDKAMEYYDKAMAYWKEALPLQEQVNNLEGLAITESSMGIGLYRMRRPSEARPHLERALKLAQQVGAVGAIESSAEALYKLYRDQGQFQKSLDMHVLYIAMRDSVQSDANRRAILQQEIDYEYQKKAFADSVQNAATLQTMALENEKVQLQERANRNMLLLGLGLVFAVAIGLWSRLRFIANAKRELQAEKDISEGLLLNILPEEVASELKAKGYTDPREFEQSTILFTDFVGFTQTASEWTAGELVEEINECFQAFDRIVDDLNIEKIKTIGDAYMAAGGLPSLSVDSVANTILAGLKMQGFIARRFVERQEQGLKAFEMRVGIHTGTVVAGIVGVKKFQYDIWGDTVNSASRMESNGAVGRVNISASTYKMVKEDPRFQFEARGKMAVKGKGEMEMWFVELVD